MEAFGDEYHLQEPRSFAELIDGEQIRRRCSTLDSASPARRGSGDSHHFLLARVFFNRFVLDASD